jgi:prepilin peptidase CpaA
MGVTLILTLVAMGAAAIALVVAAVVDVRQRIIPDGAVLTVASAGLALRAINFGPTSFAISAAMAFAILVGLGLLAGRGIIGGGDAKLIAAASLLRPPFEVPALMLHIALAGGVLALGYLAHNQLTAIKLRGNAGRLARPSDPIPSLPYGVAILGGVLSSGILEGIQ